MPTTTATARSSPAPGFGWGTRCCSRPCRTSKPTRRKVHARRDSSDARRGEAWRGDERDCTEQPVLRGIRIGIYRRGARRLGERVLLERLANWRLEELPRRGHLAPHVDALGVEGIHHRGETAPDLTPGLDERVDGRVFADVRAPDDLFDRRHLGPARTRARLWLGLSRVTGHRRRVARDRRRVARERFPASTLAARAERPVRIE